MKESDGANQEDQTVVGLWASLQPNAAVHLRAVTCIAVPEEYINESTGQASGHGSYTLARCWVSTVLGVETAGEDH
ncbi:hypothetical protein E2C01_012842 [Portunus trituberculatus]|uniref:Uncharacterized protein n=1 Tax=Portunus trituberculatus TaxID=210409 RepID=A0A5B7DER5_PORTR|nr:hypothetical protein [Portunus trituberculatus]